jgi:hypothetical protein
LAAESAEISLYSVRAGILFLQLERRELYASVGYDERMKSKLDPRTTPEQKMQRFQTALRRVLTVSKDDLNMALAEDEKIRRQRKRKPGPKPRSSVSGHASDSGA